MKSLRNYLFSTTTALLIASVPVAAEEAHNTNPAVRSDYEHVLLISVDGMHAVDLVNWIQNNPGSNFAKLASAGIIYPNAFTTAPSDSYPGMIAQVTGASSKTAGLFYDDSYDRTVYPSKAFYTSQGLADPGCTGSPGVPSRPIQNRRPAGRKADPQPGGGPLNE